MGHQLLNVTHMGSTNSNRIGIYFYAEWFPNMGFIQGALVQVVPENDELVLNLCDENITKYSELDAQTRERGGKLVQVCTPCDESAYRKTKYCPTLRISGPFLNDVGFAFKDTLLAKYTHGQIRISKLHESLRLTTIFSSTETKTKKVTPKVKLNGEWLLAFGFESDSLVAVSSEPGSMTFILRDEGIEKYSELVRYARQNKMSLLQVRTALGRGKPYPYIKMTGANVERAGFSIGDTVVAFCEPGLIKLQAFDCAELSG